MLPVALASVIVALALDALDESAVVISVPLPPILLPIDRPEPAPPFQQVRTVHPRREAK
jgi:hypothetical protein